MKKRYRFYLIFTVIFMFPVLCTAFTQWPDTGQTTKYTSTFGEDADYTINPPTYTKLGYNGVELPDTATQADGWIMTRDNVTGLIWEIKTDDGSIHDRDNTYTWDNTEAFISAANSDNFGGFSDWRMPTVKELSTIINFSRYEPSINTVFFPETISLYYWSSTINAESNDLAWCIGFHRGYVKCNRNKSSNYYVRAVRDVH